MPHPPVSMVLDPGATETFVSPDSFPEKKRFKVDTTGVTFGGGQREVTDVGIKLGSVKALVIPHLVDNLFSPNESLALGGRLVLEAQHGSLTNAAGTRTIPFFRQGKHYRCWAADVIHYDNSGKNSHKLRKGYEDIRSLRELIFPYETSGLPGEIKPSARLRKLTGDSVMQRFIHIHELSGHVHWRLMCKAIEGPNPAWRNVGLSSGQIQRCAKKYKCPVCILAKRKKDPARVNIKDNPLDVDPDISSLSSKNCAPGEIISFDPVGPITPLTAEGRGYFFLFKDIKTGYNHAVTSARVDTECTKEALRIVLDWYSQWGCKPRLVRTDCAAVLTSDALKDWLFKTYTVRTEHSAPYSQWQNAVERDVQTICAGTSALLHSQDFLKADKWDLALFHFIDVRNRTPNVRGQLSPHQIITKEVLDFNRSFKFAFGDIVASALPGSGKHWQFDLKNELGIYVGQCENAKDVNKIYFPASRSILPRLMVWKIDVSEKQFLRHYAQRYMLRDQSTSFVQIRNAFFDFEKAVQDDPVALQEWKDKLKPLSESLVSSEAEDDQDPFQDAYQPPVPEAPNIEKPSADTSKRKLRSGQEYELIHFTIGNTLGDFYDVYGMCMFTSLLFSVKDTPGKALKSSYRADWILAMIKEIQSLISGGTLVDTPDEEIVGPHRIIHSTMQLKRKLHQNQSLDKFKARLCACGNELFGLTAETFSPTIGALAYACVHQIAVIDGMHRQTIDTVGAYLYQDYPDSAIPLYITIDDKISEVCGLRLGAKYRVRKYIYGLPDAGLAYYRAYSSHLITNGYSRSNSDPCLFIRLVGDVRTYIFTHVDDTFICSTDQTELDRFVEKMRLKFSITIQEEVTEYLGIKLTDQIDGSVLMTQPKLLSSLKDEYTEELSRLQTRGEPVPLRIQDLHDMEESDEMDQIDYLHLLGALIYMTKSRPDISTAVSFAATWAAKPTVRAFQELLLILKYLISTEDKGLLLKKGDRGAPLVLTCYCDASYLTHRDSRSQSGYTMSFGTIGTFYSKSVKQTLVSTSSTHAELRAVYTLVVDIIYIVYLCQELARPVKLPAIILEDNNPVIQITSTVQSRVKRCKHFLMLVHYVREQVIQGLIEIRKIDTKDNLADVLTKIVTGNEFTTKADLILGRATTFQL